MKRNHIDEMQSARMLFISKISEQKLMEFGFRDTHLSIRVDLILVRICPVYPLLCMKLNYVCGGIY